MRIVIAEDSALLRAAIVRVLEEAGFEVPGQAGDADELLRKVRAHRPDVAIVDIRMPPTQLDEGLRAARSIRAEHPETGVLLLSQHVEERYATELLEHGTGGVGYLVKDRLADTSQLADAVRLIAAGGTVLDTEVISHMVGRRRRNHALETLNERDLEVLTQIAAGASNHAIAERMYLSKRAIERHVTTIFDKLGLAACRHDHRRVLAVLAYLRAA
jgi:DNA-binding NarL/FixJ family response regulator